jgi:hypothetical protein
VALGTYAWFMCLWVGVAVCLGCSGSCWCVTAWTWVRILFGNQLLAVVRQQPDVGGCRGATTARLDTGDAARLDSRVRCTDGATRVGSRVLLRGFAVIVLAAAAAGSRRERHPTRLDSMSMLWVCCVYAVCTLCVRYVYAMCMLCARCLVHAMYMLCARYVYAMCVLCVCFG